MKVQQPLPLRFRVLIVDDEEIARSSGALELELIGLEPVIAVGHTVDQLKKEAIQLARSRRCHLALVDTQLQTGDRTDRSGIGLIPDLKPAYCIVYSGSDRTDASTMNQARDLGAVAYVRKGHDDLQTAIKEVLERHWNLKLKYDLQRTFYTPKAILSQLFPAGSEISSDDIPEDEIDSLLRQLFLKETHTLELESLERTLHSSTTPSLRRSVVLFCEARNEAIPGGRRQIIKLAPAGDIVREGENYDQYVKPHLQHQYTALVLDHKVSWDVGIILYTDETTGKRRRLTEWYADSQPGQIARVINHLYGKVLKPWYDLHKGEANKSRASIVEHYTDPFRFKRFSSHITKFPERESMITIGAFSGLINPVVWVEQNKGQSWFRTYWNTYIHGDLHSGNIIVDEEGHAYVIDYERTGPGYCLRDFVELEKDVRLRLLSIGDNELLLALHFDLVLMKQIYPDRFPKWEDPRFLASTITEEKKQELIKAFTAVRSIRRAAFEIFEFTDMREYYWALLMETLISGTDPRLVPSIRQRSLLSASIICERLQLWNRPQGEWPPKNFRNLFDARKTSECVNVGQRPVPALKLQLTSMKENSFKVVVFDQPNRQPHAVSQLPFWSDDLAAVMKLLELGGYQSDIFSPVQTTALERLGLLQDSRLVDRWCERIGDRLFKALVPAEGGVRTAFANVFYTDRKGRELQILFDEDATDLACQPWEMIHDGFPRKPRTSIDVVRYIASERMAQPLQVPQDSCHILYVTARPRGYTQPAHDRDAIKNSIASSAPRPRFAFHELVGHTHEALKRRLLDTSPPPVHVLHFDGHGTFARLCPRCGTLNHPHQLACANENCHSSLGNTSARGYLLFEDDNGNADFIDTTQFVEGIQRSEVRLVVLSSCHSARVRGADLLLAGVGPGLILAGVPAVVAMQFSISDQDAITFNREFYTALAQGDSLPNAVFRARTMLKEPARWSPVLYLRSKDHQIHLCPPK